MGWTSHKQFVLLKYWLFNFVILFSIPYPFVLVISHMNIQIISINIHFISRFFLICFISGDSKVSLDCQDFGCRKIRRLIVKIIRTTHMWCLTVYWYGGTWWSNMRANVSIHEIVGVEGRCIVFFLILFISEKVMGNQIQFGNDSLRFLTQAHRLQSFSKQFQFIQKLWNSILVLVLNRPTSIEKSHHKRYGTNIN